ncbi:MAG TPA: glycosyltransferase family 2 protein [Kofleriaceae bacterium]
MTLFDTTVVIPTHRSRGAVDDPASLLGQAVASVHAGLVVPRSIIITEDTTGAGAAKTRQAALDLALGVGVNPADHIPTEWVSFLDSDDLWYPNHLATHRRLLVGESGTEDLGDVAYSWFDGNGIAKDWEATHRGKTWDPRPGMGHHITMTITVRSAFARQASFLGPELHPDWTGEDWRFILQLNELGARFVGTGELTWHYRVHGGNTSGSPQRGDALT